MQEQQTEQKQQANISQLAACKRFGQYKKEERKEVREADVTVGEGYKRLMSFFLKEIEIKPRSGWSQDHFDKGRFYSIYDHILRSSKQFDYTAADVAAFCQALNRIDGGSGPKLEVSAFLSAIVNAGKEMEYVLPLNHTDGDFPYLGYENKKNVTIIGDVNSIGDEMRSGTIVVHGFVEDVGQGMKGGQIIIESDCESIGNQMEGGEIIVKGSVRKGANYSGGYVGIGFGTSGGKIVVSGDCENVMNVSQGDITIGGSVKKVGMRNNGATIRINGDVTDEIGRWMWDGEIHIGGEIPEMMQEFHGGKIFHKGKLIVDKPKSYPGATLGKMDIKLR